MTNVGYPSVCREIPSYKCKRHRDSSQNIYLSLCANISCCTPIKMQCIISFSLDYICCVCCIQLPLIYHKSMPIYVTNMTRIVRHVIWQPTNSTLEKYSKRLIPMYRFTMQSLLQKKIIETAEQYIYTA